MSESSRVGTIHVATGMAAAAAVLGVTFVRRKARAEEEKEAEKLTHTTSMWNCSIASIEASERHPFLLAMLDGTLNLEKFKYYVEQDSIYLKHFADALRLAAKSAPTREDAKTLRDFATGAEYAEMTLHEDFFKQWSHDPSNAQASPTTTLYTSYLLRVCATGRHAEALAALLPCFVVYMHVGCKMLDKRKEMNNAKRPAVFDQWIDMYGGEAFGDAVRRYRLMTERAALSASPEVIKLMHTHFDRSCILEWMFWKAALDLDDWPKF